MAYQAEYIWLDGTEPTPLLRSKTKILRRRDRRARRSGASTARPPTRPPATRATACSSPVVQFHDPIRGGDNVLVMCEVMLVEARPHPTNTRAAAARIAKKYEARADVRHRAGVHDAQPTARRSASPPAAIPAPQGPYYCGVGADGIIGREIVEIHTRRLPRRRPVDLGHQRRGHARPVGVPDRPARPDRRRRPDARRPLAVAPHRRGLRRAASASTPSPSRATGTAPALTPTSPRSECVRARRHKYIEAAAKAIGAKLTCSIATTTATASRIASPAAHETSARGPVQLRRVRPRCLDPHPVAGRNRRQGVRSKTVARTPTWTPTSSRG